METGACARIACASFALESSFKEWKPASTGRVDADDKALESSFKEWKQFLLTTEGAARRPLESSFKEWKPLRIGSARAISISLLNLPLRNGNK